MRYSDCKALGFEVRGCCHCQGSLDPFPENVPNWSPSSAGNREGPLGLTCRKKCLRVRKLFQVGAALVESVGANAVTAVCQGTWACNAG